MHIPIGRGSRPLRYQRRHRHQDKFGAQISGRFDAPLVELTDLARSAPPCCGGLRLELSYRTAHRPSTLFPGKRCGGRCRCIISWTFQIFLESIFIDQATLNGTRPNSPSGVKPARDISDAPDSWRRRRTLESVSFEEASQLRSFDYLSSVFMEAKPSQMLFMLFLRCSWRRSPRRCCSCDVHGGLSVVVNRINSSFLSAIRGACCPMHDSRRRSGGWAVRYIKCCSNPFGGGPRWW